MSEWWNFAVFPLVGATIGMLTNQVAIRMLFRPFKPVMLGRYRVPFTPGVIPAQREKIAARAARSFEANLFSRDDLHAVMTGARVKTVLEEKVEEFFGDFGILGGMLGGFKPAVVKKVLEAIEAVGQEALVDGGQLDISAKIEERINSMDLEKLEAMILDVSRKQLQHITMFGGLLGAIIGIAQAALSVVM